MSAKENKDLSRHFFERLDQTKARITEAQELFTPDFTARMSGQPPMSLEEFKGFGMAFFAAFPDLQHVPEDQVAEGDLVATRLTIRGTHQGAFQGIPPTGRQVELSAINIDRFVNGKIAEKHIVFDALGMMRQLGVVPTPEQAGT
jgi:steroid delta-isomerase-like uncharacterized protein